MIDLSIIIVNYNSVALAKDAILSIKKHLKISYEIIVIDNSENEEEIESAASAFADDTNLRFKHVPNHGYGAANNEGAKMARGKYLLLLNPDTLLTDESLVKMLNFLSAHDEVGAISPLIYQEDGKTLQHHFYGHFLSLGGITLKKWQGEGTNLNKEINNVDMVTGASLMIKKELFDRVGGFDENFFMYVEDDDLCRRLQELGYKNAVYTKAKIIHLEGKSSTSRNKKLMYYKSQDYYWRKHYGAAQTVLMRIIRWPYKTIRLLAS